MNACGNRYRVFSISALNLKSRCADKKLEALLRLFYRAGCLRGAHESMIQLTRLNHHPFFINCELIKTIENTPDTVLTLVAGEKIVVLESSAEVVEKIVEFRRRILPEQPWQAVASTSPGAARESSFPAGKS
jgi:flagellar protein FlbD